MLKFLLARTFGFTLASALIASGCSEDSLESMSSMGSPTSSTALGAHSVTINWRAPTENADGSPLMDLAGFRIQHGTRSNVYSRVIEVPDSRTTTLTIDNLSAGTHFFSVTAYNRSNVDGVVSQELAIRLP